MSRNHEAVVGRNDIYRVDPTKVKVVSGWNPRSSFDAQKMEELKDSIKENGVLMPIRVKINSNDEMVLIDGERRLRATLLAISEGVEILSVPAFIERKTMNEIEMLVHAMVSNQGEPLTMVEEANAIGKLHKYGLKIEDIAKKLGKSYQTINNRLSLLDASPELIEEMEKGEVSFSDVKKIVKDSDGLDSQQEKLKEVKEKKAKRKSEGKKASAGKKEYAELLKEAVEWLNELNVEKLSQVEELIERINEAVDA